MTTSDDQASTVEEYEDLVVRMLGNYLLTAWQSQIYQPLGLRELTHSTASMPGLSFESIRLDGRYPRTQLAIYFRDVTRCSLLFGWRVLFWEFLSVRYKCAKPPGYLFSPSQCAELLWDDFFESVDIHSPELPPTESCNFQEVNWVYSPDIEVLTARPWIGIDRGNSDARPIPSVSNLLAEFAK